MTDFKIDYQVRRDNKGQDSVYEVYIPSKHKGWVTMAERKDTASPGVEALQSDVSLSEVKVEKPSEEPQEPLPEDSHDVSVPKPSGRRRQVRSGPEYRLKRLAKLNAVNGVVLPSKLKPGQPPFKTRFGPKDCARVRSNLRNTDCPICGDWFPKYDLVQTHFIACVGKNGNPQGYYWNGALNNERRIGKEVAEMYARWDGGGDQHTETSTSDRSSSDDPRTMSYKPSESCSHSQASSSPSQAPTSSLSHDRNDYTGASSQVRTQTDPGHKTDVIEILVEQLGDSAAENPRVSTEGRAESMFEAAKRPLQSQPRDLQAHTSLSPHGKHYDNVKRAWVSPTTTIEGQHQSGANTIEANGHGCIPGDFSAMRTPPKTAFPTPTSSECRTTSNAYSIPTPVTPGDFGASRPPVPSPSIVMVPLTSTAGYTNRYRDERPDSLPSLPPAGATSAKKRPLHSGPPQFSRSSKRPRIAPGPALPSIEVDLLQAKPAAGPIRQSIEQGPQTPPASAKRSALILSKNGPMCMDGNHAGVRQSKGSGLRIDTKAAESGAPPMPEKEPTSGKKLFADYPQTHKDFRRELDNLAEKLDTANKRADAAELRSQRAENEVYRANNAGFAKLKHNGDMYQKELQRQQSLQTSLQVRCDALEQSIRWKNRWIEDLKRELEQERQMSGVVRSEYGSTVEKSVFGASLGRE